MRLWRSGKTTAAIRPAGAEPPPAGRFWRAAQNLLVLVTLWMAGVAAIHLGGAQKRHVGLAEGQRAPATVVAAVDFDCVNIAATELLRRQAAESVVPAFSIQMGPLQAAWRTMDKLAERIVTLRREADKAPPKTEGSAAGTGKGAKAFEADLAVVADLLGVSVPGEALARLFLPGKEMEALSALKDSLSQVWLGGIVADADRESGFQGVSQSATIDILLPEEGGPKPAFRSVALADLSLTGKALEIFAENAGRRLLEAGVETTRNTLEELVRPAMRPNLAYDEAITEARRNEARQGVAAVIMTVRAGTTLMEERTTITRQTVEMIEAYNRRLAEIESPFDRWMKRLGDSALMLVVLVACAGWLRSERSGGLAQGRSRWLLVTLGLLATGMAAAGRYLSASLGWVPPWLMPFALPITLPAMLAALLLGSRAALVVGLWSSLSAALVFDRGLEMLLLGLGSSVAVVLLLRNARKRAQVMRAGLGAGALEALVALALAATYQHLPATILAEIGTALGSGMLAAILATLLLPFMEWLFQRNSAISLLELTDMSHPLLQRLALEAPGTYHHSLMVGAIGQAAANRIGANGLLVAVCAYFHDIGKLAKPEFFGENQRPGENPHDSLAPSMSALVIQSHVKEGLTLAKRYQLPLAVCDAIRSHHGTSLASYFYHVAKRALHETGQSEDGGLEHHYRYDGPKPGSRELAILMLADGVEAASRSLDRVTPNRIAEMVAHLLRDKLLDGQLDRAPLTMEELHEIQASFVFSLTNILHGRNPYPREDSLAHPPGSAGRAAGGVPAPGPGTGRPGVSG